MKKIKLIIFFSLISFIVEAQSFEYKSTKNVENDYLSTLKNLTEIKNNNFKNGKDLTIYLPKNYSTKGNVDYTAYIQKGLNENLTVILPNFPIMVAPNGLKISSGAKILFQKKSQLIIKPNKQSSYQAILIDNVEDVQIFYPNILGDRYNHLDDKGQWGMGIWINNSKNIYISSPYITNCWGDGIYIGNKNDKPSSNINIVNGWLDNNRRNGISIIAGKDINISKTLISNTNGHNPQSGIDIEPNNKTDYVKNVSIKDVTTYNNHMHGIVISTGNLTGNLTDKININIDNHVDYYSTIGLGLSITRDKDDKFNPLIGVISIKNSTYYTPKKIYFKNYKGRFNNVKLRLDNINFNGRSNSKNIEDLKKFKIGYSKNIEETIR